MANRIAKEVRLLREDTAAQRAVTKEMGAELAEIRRRLERAAGFDVARTSSHNGQQEGRCGNGAASVGNGHAGGRQPPHLTAELRLPLSSMGAR